MCHFQKRVCKVISFSNSKLESLYCHQTFFALPFLLFSFLSLLPSFLLSYHLLSFIHSFLLSIFRISFLLSLFCSFFSSFLSPSFLTIFPLFLPLSDIFTLFLSSFLPWPLPSFSQVFATFLPYCSPSLPSSLLPSFYLSVHSSYFFRLVLLCFLLYFFLVDESLQVLCVLNDEVAAFNSAAVRGCRVPPSPPHTTALSL